MRSGLLADLVEEGGTFRVSAALRGAGDDLIVILQGGKGHIGAVGIAQPRPSLSDPARMSSTSSVYTFPGHKEDDIAKTMAQALASGLGCRVVVVAGLHWDGISPEGIDQVVAMCRALTSRIVEEAGGK